MKKNIFLLLGGIAAGFALCLTTAMMIPLEDDPSMCRSRPANGIFKMR